MKFLSNLKKKWKITSNLQLVIILVVFAITGSLSLYITQPVLNFIGANPEFFGKWYTPFRIIIIFPIYQVLIIIIGTIFGQFDFFWSLEKKMLSRIGFKRFIKPD